MVYIIYEMLQRKTLLCGQGGADVSILAQHEDAGNDGAKCFAEFLSNNNMR